MTVKELKEALDEYEDEMEVVAYMGESIEKLRLIYDSSGVEKVQVD